MLTSPEHAVGKKSKIRTWRTFLTFNATTYHSLPRYLHYLHKYVHTGPYIPAYLPLLNCMYTWVLMHLQIISIPYDKCTIRHRISVISVNFLGSVISYSQPLFLHIALHHIFHLIFCVYLLLLPTAEVTVRSRWRPNKLPEGGGT